MNGDTPLASGGCQTKLLVVMSLECLSELLILLGEGKLVMITDILSDEHIQPLGYISP